MPVNPTPAEGVVVPLEATDAMMDAMFDAARQRERHMDGGVGYVQLRAAWEAALAARPAAPTQSAAQTGEVDLPPISLDGPHKPDGNRLWLSRQLLDSRLTAEEAYSIVAYSPSIQDALSQPEQSQ